MTTIIRKNLSKADIQELLKKVVPVKRFNAFKYCGVIKLTIDPLKFQRQLRDEWE